MRKLITAVVLSVVLGVPSAAFAVTLPTQSWGLQARPWVVDYTGDATAFLGGWTNRKRITPADFRRNRHRGLRSNFGRLTWTTWNAREGRAWGVDWLNNGRPSNAEGTFYVMPVNVRVYRLNASGIFTRLEILSKRNKVLDRRFAERQFGHWIWGVQ